MVTLSKEGWDLVEKAHEAIIPGAAKRHLLCPTLRDPDAEDDDEQDQDTTIARVRNACRAFFIIFNKELEGHAAIYRNRINANLSSCDVCVLNWHRCRTHILEEIAG